MGVERGRHAWAVLAAATLWGTIGTVANQAPEGSVQFLIGLCAFGFGGLTLFALDSRSSLQLLRDRSVLPLVLLGALGVILFAGLFYLAMDLAGVAITYALSAGSGPVFAAMLEGFVERRRVARLWMVGTAVSIAGIALLASSANESTTGAHPVIGIWTGLGSGFGYALYTWAGARAISRGYSSRPVMAALFASASLILLPAFFLIGPGPLVSPRGVLILAYLSIVSMAAAYLLFGYGLRGMPASTATALALAAPVVGTLLAVIVLHERLAVVGWLGLALILLGIMLVSIAERHKGKVAKYVPSYEMPN